LNQESFAIFKNHQYHEVPMLYNILYVRLILKKVKTHAGNVKSLLTVLNYVIQMNIQIMKKKMKIYDKNLFNHLKILK